MAVPLIQAIRHQVGWLISDFNGSIIESSGQLLNQASIAAQALSLLQDTQQIIQQQPLRRLEIAGSKYSYRITLTAKHIYVVKLEQPNSTPS
eukprot:m.242946 g.242946  ORF g.242946 m.242946 type:complete len:92 (+) comp17457_c1_seq1:2810-3085(+)